MSTGVLPIHIRLVLCLSSMLPTTPYVSTLGILRPSLAWQHFRTEDSQRGTHQNGPNEFEEINDPMTAGTGRGSKVLKRGLLGENTCFANRSTNNKPLWMGQWQDRT